MAMKTTPDTERMVKNHDAVASPSKCLSDHLEIIMMGIEQSMEIITAVSHFMLHLQTILNLYSKTKKRKCQ